MMYNVLSVMSKSDFRLLMIAIWGLGALWIISLVLQNCGENQEYKNYDTILREKMKRLDEMGNGKK